MSADMLGRRGKWLSAALLVLALAPALSVRADGARGPVIRRVFNANDHAALPNSWTIAGQTYASPTEYADLRNGCMELLRRYRPDQYFFVGLGRDPAPVIAFLQNLGGRELAVNLPGTSNINWNGRVTAADVARHVEAAIPEHILKGERTIVVLDVTSSGKTPAVFGPYLDTYLQGRGNTKRPVRLAFSWQNVMQGPYGSQLTDWIDTRAWQDFTQYYTGKYEGGWTPQAGGTGIAEHQRHQMGPGVMPPTATNPNYTAFRQALQARMQQDQELDTFLAPLAPRRPQRPAPPARPWFATLAHRTSAATKAAPARGSLFSVVDRRARESSDGDGDGADGQAARPQPDSYDYLSQPEYEQLRAGAISILRHADPNAAYYVGVGRSSGPLVAFLERLGRDVATYLPADGLSKLAAGHVKSGTADAFNRLFDAFIPREALIGTRKIVLFQRSSSGASLPYLQNELAAYLQRHGSTAQVDTLALGEQAPAQGGFIDIRNSSELRALSDRKYQIISPYRYFRPGRTSLDTVFDSRGQPIERSRAYARFKTALGERMSRDTVLEQTIRALPARPAPARPAPARAR